MKTLFQNHVKSSLDLCALGNRIPSTKITLFSFQRCTHLYSVDFFLTQQLCHLISYHHNDKTQQDVPDAQVSGDGHLHVCLQALHQCRDRGEQHRNTII